MVNSKIYLDVPYAQKDEAKSLGARWDPSKKKWYVPGNLDISVFKKWNKATSAAPSTIQTDSKKSSTGLGTITYAKDKNFIAYDGEQPPWN